MPKCIVFFLFLFLQCLVPLSSDWVYCDERVENVTKYKDNVKDIFEPIPNQECVDVKTGNPIRSEQRCDYVEDCVQGEDEELCGYVVLPTRWDRRCTTNINFDYVWSNCSDNKVRSFYVLYATRIVVGQVTSPIFQPTFSECFMHVVNAAKNFDTKYAVQLEQLSPSGSVKADILASNALQTLPRHHIYPFGYVDVDLSNINVPFRLSLILEIPLNQFVIMYQLELKRNVCGRVLSNAEEMGNASLYLCDDKLRRVQWQYVCDGKSDCNDGSDENVPGLCDKSKQCTFENNIQGTFFNESTSQAEDREFRPESSMMVPQLDHTNREPLSPKGKMKVALLGTIASGKYLRTYKVLSPCATFWIMQWRCTNLVLVNDQSFNLTASHRQHWWQRVWIDLTNATSVTISASAECNYEDNEGFLAIDDFYFGMTCDNSEFYYERLYTGTSSGNIWKTTALVIAVISVILALSLLVKVIYSRRQVSRYHDHIELFLRMQYNKVKRKKWDVDDKLLVRGSRLGGGNFGYAYQTEIKINGASSKIVIEKIVRRKRNVSQVHSLFNELRVMMELGKHINIVELVGAVTSNVKLGELKLLTEYCENGNLSSFLKVKILTIDELNEFSYQAARGMEYVASKNYVHRDLSARNIFVTIRNILKIGDFGSAGIEGESFLPCAIHPLWTAPEAVERQWSTKSDVFSYGIMLWEIYAFGKEPNHVVAEDGPLRQPDLCPDETYHLMTRCWKAVAIDRPSFSDAVSHFRGTLSDERLHFYVNLIPESARVDGYDENTV